MKWLDELGKEMVAYLPDGNEKAYVQVEFIVDKDGMPVNFKVLRSFKDADFNDELIDRMQNMPNWQPAILNDKPVAKKMVQTVTVEDQIIRYYYCNQPGWSPAFAVAAECFCWRVRFSNNSLV